MDSAAPGFDLGDAHAVDGEELIDQHERRMGRILAQRQLQRIARLLDVVQRAEAEARRGSR